MIVYIVCMNHKRTLNYIEIIEVFFSEKNAYKFKTKFNENRPPYSMAEIRTSEIKDRKNEQ